VTTQGGGAPEEYHPRLVWDALPAVLTAGEPVELSLRVRDWEPGRSLRPGPFRTTAPVDAILEELPLSASDPAQGRVLRIRLTPLGNAAGAVSLAPFTLRFDTLSLEAPAISIRLRPPLAADQKSGEPPSRDPGNAAPEAAPLVTQGQWTEIPPPPFPEITDEPFPLFRKAYEETLDTARELWSRACYAEALGELRRGERDLLAGPRLAAPRRAAEQALGLTQTAGTADEKWRPRNFFIALAILSFCLLLLTILLPLRSRRKGSRLVLLLLAGVFGLAVSPLEKTRPEAGYLKGNTAVLRADIREPLSPVAAYRVPDTQGAISARWIEGQPVHIRAAAGSWAYAESPDGDAGWVPQNNLIFY
jgi:hypothetical protein